MNGARSGGDDRLTRICGVSGLAFLVLIALFLLSERAALPRELLEVFLVIGTLAIYASVGLLSRTGSLSEYLLAGRHIPAPFAGVTAGSEWLGPAIILSATGSLLLANHDGHALVLALTGGYVLAALLVAPFVRNTGASSLPEFLGLRFGGAARFVALLVLIACTLPLAVALVQAAMLLIARELGLDTNAALSVVIAMVAVCALPGGMRGVTATQVTQYVVLLTGGVTLFLIVEAQRFDIPAGSTYDPVVQALLAIARGMGLSPSLSPRSIPFSLSETVNNAELVLCLMAGTASLPHILLRPATTATTGQARMSLAWTLLFVLALALALPTFFALAADDAARDRGSLHGLVFIIGLTAMLAAATGAILTLANSLAHDLHGIVAPKAAPVTRLIVMRVMLVIVIAAIAYAAAILPPEPLNLTEWAFSLAAAGYFPALVLGIWWRRTTAAAAVCGMLAGLAVTLFYLVVTRYFPQVGVSQFGMSPLLDAASGQPLTSEVGWLDVSNLACGVFGLPVGFITVIAFSLMTRPSPQGQAALAAVRTPANAQRP
jgi:cation/acetate symporter